MKTLLLAVFLFLFSLPAQSQIWGWEFNFVSAGTGDGPVMSGVSVTVNFEGNRYKTDLPSFVFQKYG